MACHWQCVVTFDELCDKVHAAQSKIIGPSDCTRVVAETLTQIGVAVEESTGLLLNVAKALPMAPPPPGWQPPEQRNVRFRGQKPRRGRR